MSAESRRQHYREIAARYRDLPGKHGLREHRVYIVVVSTSGTHTGDGTRTETVTELTNDGQGPKVVWANGQDVAMGLASMGQVTVGPLTPLPGGETDDDLLSGADLTVGQVRLLRITGPNITGTSEDYTIKSVTADRALRRLIVAVPVGSQVE